MSKEHFETEYTTLNGFGKKQLEKFGWKSGDGLGKERDGDKEFVKVAKRTENAGLGTTKNKKLNNYWWENMYNDLLQKNDSKKETVSKKSDSDSEEEQIKPIQMKSNENGLSAQYRYGGSFVKATSKNQIKNIESIQVEKQQNVETSSNSDSSESEEDIPKSTTKPAKSTVLQNNMFEACEGNTLKKYRQVGKMKRLEEAEQKLKEQVEKMKSQLQQSQQKSSILQQRTTIAKQEEKSENEVKSKKPVAAQIKLKNVKIESESEEEEEEKPKPKKLLQVKQESDDEDASVSQKPTFKQQKKAEEITKTNKRKNVEQDSESEISDFEEEPKSKKSKIKNR